MNASRNVSAGLGAGFCEEFGLAPECAGVLLSSIDFGE